MNHREFHRGDTSVPHQAFSVGKPEQDFEYDTVDLSVSYQGYRLINLNRLYSKKSFQSLILPSFVEF